MWWRREDPTRTLRFDLFAFPGCTAKFGRLDIGFVRLPRAGASYLDDIGADRLIADLGQLANLTNLKHLVYYDGPPVFDDNVCGTAFVPRSATTNGGLAGIAFVWTKSLCGGDIGAGGLNAAVAVHELIHGLGSLQGSPLRTSARRPTTATSATSRRTCSSRPRTARRRSPARPGRGQERLLRPLPGGIRRPGLRVAHAPAPAASVRDDSDDGNAYRCRSARLADGVRVRPVVHARPRPGSGRHARGCTAGGSAVRSLDGRLHGQRLVRCDAQRGARGDSRLRRGDFPAHDVRRGQGQGLEHARRRLVPRPLFGGLQSRLERPVRAAASPGFRFAGWTGSCRGTGQCIVKLSRDRSVRATFRRK